MSVSSLIADDWYYLMCGPELINTRIIARELRFKGSVGGKEGVEMESKWRRIIENMDQNMIVQFLYFITAQMSIRPGTIITINFISYGSSRDSPFKSHTCFNTLDVNVNAEVTKQSDEAICEYLREKVFPYSGGFGLS